MAGNSHIEWTDATWNPVPGCTKISPACKHCYAERLAKRLQAIYSTTSRPFPKPKTGKIAVKVINVHCSLVATGLPGLRVQ
jgi:protein gp37